MGTELTGSADGDSGATQPNTAGSNGTPTANPSAAQLSNATPGRRLKNPLGQLSSYTYQLSLYMITPDAYDAFITTGRKNIQIFNQAVSTPTTSDGTPTGGGAFLIAQSGGVGAKSARAPGLDFDYGIDNLSFKHFVSTKAQGSSAFNTELKFTITEPYGFSFITKLKTTQQAILDYSKGKSLGPGNPTKQFFVIGIRFFGYDASGMLMTGKEQFDGEVLDPNASGSGALFETFYDIMITSVKFKIDGRATVYDINAVTVPPMEGFGVKKGYVKESIDVSGYNIKDMLEGPNGLFTQMNKKQQDMLEKNTIQYPIKYSVDWSFPGAEVIANTLMSDLELDSEKSKRSSSNAASTGDSNDKTAAKAAPNLQKVTLNLSGPIVQSIDLIIVTSTYLNAGLRVQYPSSADQKNNEVKTKKPGIIGWYNLSTRLSNPRWDAKIKDWAYDITYVIHPYDTPVVASPYVVNADGTKSVYMPFKRYEYWYSGKNSEIIEYTQTLDNLFYTVVLADSPQAISSNGGDQTVSTTDGTNSGSSTNSATNNGAAPNVPGQATDSPTTNKLGAGGQAKGEFQTSLFDPGSLVHAKVTILGDPDFLVQDSATTDAFYSKYYGSNGFTVNPTGGQVFFEIDFKEALDYNSQTGLLDINEKILFWDYPENVKKMGIRGLSYQLITIQSQFSNGVFKQTLDAVMNSFGGPIAGNESGRENPSANTTTNAGSTPTGKNTPGNTGLVKDTPPNTSSNTSANIPPLLRRAPPTN